MKSPIFIIGMPRCGQQNILQAYRMIGLSPMVHDYVEDDTEAIEFEDRHFYSGDLINKQWKSLAEEHANSKFVVVTTEVYSWLYEIKSEERSKDKDKFEKYYAEIEEYFNDKSNRCLTINIADEDAVYRLANFVGLQLPPGAHFPPLGLRHTPGFLGGGNRL